MRTIKGLLSKNTDPYLALLSYQSTPLENGYRPAKLLMGHKLRTNIPVNPSQLVPCLPVMSEVTEKEKQIRDRQKILMIAISRGSYSHYMEETVRGSQMSG